MRLEPVARLLDVCVELSVRFVQQRHDGDRPVVALYEQDELRDPGRGGIQKRDELECEFDIDTLLFLLRSRSHDLQYPRNPSELYLLL